MAQFIEQLFGYFRDCMAAVVDCPAESFLYVSPSSQEAVVEAGRRLGLQTVLAVMQILDHCLSRLRVSTHARILAELAVVRICHLEDLDELSSLVKQAQSGIPADGLPTSRAAAPQGSTGPSRTAPSTEAVKKKGLTAAPPPVDTNAPPAPSRPAIELTPDNAAQIWADALERISGMVAEQAKLYDRVSVAGTNRLAISFKAGYAFQKSCCERPEQVSRFQEALAEVTGQPIRVEFTVDGEPSGGSPQTTQPARPVASHQRLLEVAEHPMVHRAGELFGARPTRVDDPPNEK